MKTIYKNGEKFQVTDELYETIKVNNPQILFESLVINKLHKKFNDIIDAYKKSKDMDKVTDMSSDEVKSLANKMVDEINNNDELKSLSGIEQIDVNRQAQDFLNKISKTEGSKQNIIKYDSGEFKLINDRREKDNETLNSKFKSDLPSQLEIYNNRLIDLSKDGYDINNLPKDVQEDIEKINKIVKDYKSDKDNKKYDGIRNDLETFSKNFNKLFNRKVINNKGNFVGTAIDDRKVINDKGEEIGEITDDGKVINNEGEEIGKITDDRTPSEKNINKIKTYNEATKSSLTLMDFINEDSIIFKQLITEMRLAEFNTRNIIEKSKYLIQTRLGIYGDAVLSDFSITSDPTSSKEKEVASYIPQGNMLNEDNQQVTTQNTNNPQGNVLNMDNYTYKPQNFVEKNKSIRPSTDILRNAKAHTLAALGGFEIQPLVKTMGFSKALRTYYACYEKNNKSRIKQMLDVYFDMFVGKVQDKNKFSMYSEDDKNKFKKMVRNFIYATTSNLEINNVNNYLTIIRVIHNDEELLNKYGVSNRNTIQQFDAKEQVLSFGDKNHGYNYDSSIISHAMVVNPTLSKGKDILNRVKKAFNRASNFKG